MKKNIAVIFILICFVSSGCAKNERAINTPGSATNQIATPTTDQTAVPTTHPSVAPTLPLTLIPEPTDAPYIDGPTVSIVKSREANAEDITEAEISQMVNEALYRTDDFRGLIKNGQTVVIKPNLVQMRVDSTGELLDKTTNGITTDWRVAHSVIKEVRALNPDGIIYVMEGSATGRTKDVMAHFNYTSEYMPEVDGFLGFEEDCGTWQDFEAPELIKVSLPDGLLHKEYWFSRILYEADVLISVPCLKTTSGVVVTAGIKNVSLGTPPGNIYGNSPDDAGKTSMVSHSMHDEELDKWIFDYYMCKPIDYVLVDGLQGFQSGPVPMGREQTQTDRMNMRTIIAGADAVAVDTVCALVTGWDPQSIGYLNHFAQHSVGCAEPGRILTLGESIRDLRRYFTIKYPNLGGVQISDAEAPVIRELNINENRVSFITDASTVKAEMFIDGFFYSLIPVTDGEGSFNLDASLLSDGVHTIKVIVYDRFYNIAEKSMNINS